MLKAVVVVVGLCVAHLSAAQAAFAQSRTPGGMPPPSGMKLDESAAMRFPQPVRVGTMIDRDVRRPVPSQQSLGTVHDVVRRANGQIMLVIRYGSWLGIGGRLIAVPMDGVALLGDVVEPVAFSVEQLAALPTFEAAGTQPLPREAEIKVGLAKPSH